MEYVVWATIKKEFLVEAPTAEKAIRYVSRFANASLPQTDSRLPDCAAVQDERAQLLGLQVSVARDSVKLYDELYESGD
jgi:hypothetical protein